MDKQMIEDQVKNRTLILAITGCNREISDEVRGQTIEAAEEVLSVEIVYEYVKEKLLAVHPPKEADIDGAIKLAEEKKVTYINTIYKAMKIKYNV